MTRIVAGAAGGHRLATPSGSGTRPTSERVREALFSRLEHHGAVVGARVLDLYAGSGALGLEAASRGARHVLLVDQARAAAAAARTNARTVGAAVGAARSGQASCEVRAEPVQRVLAGGPGEGAAYDLVLLDPPYDLAEATLSRDLLLLLDHGWLASSALVVVERSTRTPEPSWPAGLERVAGKSYGETAVWFAEQVQEQADAGTGDQAEHRPDVGGAAGRGPSHPAPASRHATQDPPRVP